MPLYVALFILEKKKKVLVCIFLKLFLNVLVFFPGVGENKTKNPVVFIPW